MSVDLKKQTTEYSRIEPQESVQARLVSCFKDGNAIDTQSKCIYLDIDIRKPNSSKKWKYII